MAAKSSEMQAREFVYDLDNCASEYGFGKEDVWQVHLVTEKDKLKLAKIYYPLMSVPMAAETIPTILSLVQGKLVKFNGMELPAGKSVVIKDTQQYLVAYNIKRTF